MARLARGEDERGREGQRAGEVNAEEPRAWDTLRPGPRLAFVAPAEDLC
jgi:hypothetical protein